MFGTPVPLSIANKPICMTMFGDGDITGTLDPESGESHLQMSQRWRVHLGISVEMPCPRCGALAQHPELGAEFTCEGGPNDGQACTVEAFSEVFGGLSADCPPDVADNVSDAGLALRFGELTTGTVATTAEIPCLDREICTDTHEPCSTNADCRRCTGDLSSCSNDSDCAAGTCAAAPAQPVSCGFYCHCGLCSNDSTRACSRDDQCENGGTCTLDGFSAANASPNRCEDLICGREQQERCCSKQCSDTHEPCSVNTECPAGECHASETCPVSTLADGTCSDQPAISCEFDFECEETCARERHRCFENEISRSGVASRIAPAYVGLACAPTTRNFLINLAGGIPGPAIISYSRTDVLCGDPNGDGQRTTADCLLILAKAIGADVDCPTSICDVNGDGKIVATDSLLTLRYSVGLNSPLQCLVDGT
jgi:hypothetical protein